MFTADCLYHAYYGSDSCFNAVHTEVHLILMVTFVTGALLILNLQVSKLGHRAVR
jgi:hypothetical protein